MTLVTTASVIVALLGSALIGGVFFAFSSFIMKALARVPSAEGIAAMQSINVLVLNPSFLGAFLGTAAVSVLVAAFAFRGWGEPAAPWYLAGAMAYLAGTFFVTLFGNVPLNEKLAAASATDPAAISVWEHYLDRWTLLNTVRTVAALIAALTFVLGLLLDSMA